MQLAASSRASGPCLAQRGPSRLALPVSGFSAVRCRSSRMHSVTVVAAGSPGFMGAEPNSKGRSLSASWSGRTSAASGSPAPTSAAGSPAGEFLQLWAGLGVLYFADYMSKSFFLQAGIKFPASLVGMFAISIFLIAVGEKNAAPIRTFFAPALNWIAKWLPVFYVPALVTLPLALQGMAGGDLAKILVILSVGMVASLVFTAKATMFIRNLVNTPTKPVGKGKSASPFLPLHYLAWAAVTVASGVAIVAAPSSAASFALPFTLSITIIGYLLGNAVPAKFQGLLHPVLSTALAGNFACALYGVMSSAGYESAMKIFLAKGAGPMGAGDLLMSFLGSVILSMGFRIYDQRDTMKRHAPEILGACLASGLFSFFQTALFCKLLTLQSDLARALIPRCVTVALALPIASQLDAPLAIAAASVLINCLLCANFGITILNALGVKDTIARGLAMAGVGGGFGTAALTSKEPEAMPFCALAYSMVGIFCTFAATTPFIRAALIGITG